MRERIKNRVREREREISDSLFIYESRYKFHPLPLPFSSLSSISHTPRSPSSSFFISWLLVMCLLLSYHLMLSYYLILSYLTSITSLFLSLFSLSISFYHLSLPFSFISLSLPLVSLTSPSHSHFSLFLSLPSLPLIVLFLSLLPLPLTPLFLLLLAPSIPYSFLSFPPCLSLLSFVAVTWWWTDRSRPVGRVPL